MDSGFFVFIGIMLGLAITLFVGGFVVQGSQDNKRVTCLEIGISKEKCDQIFKIKN